MSIHIKRVERKTTTEKNNREGGSKQILKQTVKGVNTIPSWSVKRLRKLTPVSKVGQRPEREGGRRGGAGTDAPCGRSSNKRLRESIYKPSKPG